MNDSDEEWAEGRGTMRFFFAMIKKNVFHSSVLTPSIDYPEFGHKKIGAAKTNWTKIGAAEKVGSQKKTSFYEFLEKNKCCEKNWQQKNPLLNGVLLLLPRPKGDGFTAFAAS